MTSSLCYSSWKPQNQSMLISDILLDKPTMIKKIRSLMLQVKGLQTKMFLSKVISYISNGEMIDSRTTTQRLKLQQFSFLKQNKSSISTAIYTKDSIDDNMETADSQYFSQAKKKQQNQLDTISQAQTVNCSCGLFDMVLNFVQSLIDSKIIQNKKEQILINQEFFNSLSKQIQSNFSSKISAKQEELKIQLLKTTDKAIQLQEQLKKQIYKSQKISFEIIQLKAQKKKKDLFQQENIQNNLRLVKQIQELKKQVQKHAQQKNQNRRKRSLIRCNEIQALKFEIQLKDQEISNLKTINQTLQTRIQTQTSLNSFNSQKIASSTQSLKKQESSSTRRIKDESLQKDQEILMIREQLNAISSQLQNLYQLNSLKDINIAKLQQQVRQKSQKINIKEFSLKQDCNDCKVKAQMLQNLTKKEKSLSMQYELLRKQFICFQAQFMKREKKLENFNLINKEKNCLISQKEDDENIRITFGSQF